MQIVIEISDETYEYISYEAETSIDESNVVEAVRKGIVLPKGHGDLIDRSEVLPYMESRFDMQELYLPIHFKHLVVDEMSTVIPADKEGD